MAALHDFHVHTSWTGNAGEGTSTYRGYRRDHLISAEGKPAIAASSAPAYRGDAQRYNPEELLVASLSSCHMLWYLHLCAVNHVVVIAYEDAASGSLRETPDGSGEFVSVTLRPQVTIKAGDPQKARQLHEEAHRFCFIANSVKFPVTIEPRIEIESAPQPSSQPAS